MRRLFVIALLAVTGFCFLAPTQAMAAANHTPAVSKAGGHGKNKPGKNAGGKKHKHKKHHKHDKK